MSLFFISQEQLPQLFPECCVLDSTCDYSPVALSNAQQHRSVLAGSCLDENRNRYVNLDIVFSRSVTWKDLGMEINRGIFHILDFSSANVCQLMYIENKFTSISSSVYIPLLCQWETIVLR